MAKILIIDDDESILSVFKRFLEGKGHEVQCASNGKQGLKMIEMELPDLVITDIMMPETDGLEVVMAVRAKNKNTPVIAISGGMHAMPIDFLPMAKKFGAGKVLYKPIDMEELHDAVEEALAG
jgi:CheY-like chemotaxis protein